MEDRRKNFLQKNVFTEYPHSQVWRVLVTIAFLVAAVVLYVTDKMSLFIMEADGFIVHPRWAICFLWLLILYLSVILWLPISNIWECLEKINYAKIEKEQFREKIRSSLVAFSIAFVVLSLSLLSIITAQKPSSQVELNIFKLVIGLLIEGVILLIVTFEVYDSCLNPAFDSDQIARLYTKGWWFYTFGIYSIVIALLLYVSLLEPLITIIGVSIFIVAFTYYLRTPCDIIKKYQNWRIAK